MAIIQVEGHSAAIHYSPFTIHVFCASTAVFVQPMGSMGWKW
jgi:hypothetical protein